MQVTTLILGAGAAGLMCAAHSGPGTLVIDHARAPGEKIRISGGGRCNFTNMHCDPSSFISDNKHFCKSALSRYTQWDFLALVDKHAIPWHEKTLGQLFCDTSAKDIIRMLLAEMRGADLWLNTAVKGIEKTASGFATTLERDGQDIEITCKNLVVATGGKSIPKMGATGLAYDIAHKFGLRVTQTRPGLVPLTFPDKKFTQLSGIATQSCVKANGPAFREALLFTHRGLSGPAILQASSYWRETEKITIDLLPDIPLEDILRERRRTEGKRNLSTELARHLPSRLVEYLGQSIDLTGNIGDLSDHRIAELCAELRNWTHLPTGSEGYRTAEVTLGGIDTAELSSKTLMSKNIPGLYFIGEAVDVTGWLGGYNFQWAWSSAWAAGVAITSDHASSR